MLAAALSVLLAFSTARIVGDSMEPTLHDGDAVLIDRIGPRLGPPARGDIVVVRQPNGVQAIKRVIGVPGDGVEIDGGHAPAALLLRPGGRGPWQRLREPYVAPGWGGPEFCCDPDGRGTVTSPTPLTLPPGEYFVLGDNRGVSIDSRAFGLVPRERIVARARLRYWPASQSRWFS